MAVLRIAGFSGRIPVTGDRALPDNFAVDAMNTWLYGSELRGVRPPVDLNVPGLMPETRRVFRIPKYSPGVPPSALGDSVWMQFPDIDTDVVKGQLIEDQYKRYYWCSPSTGPMFNTYDRIVANQPGYKLGVPGPDDETDADGFNPWRPTLVSVAAIIKGKDIREIEFKIAATGSTNTAYSNSGGSGDRTAIINTSASTMQLEFGGTPSAANVSKLIDGTNNTGLKFNDLSAADQIMRFDFPGLKLINEFRWKQADSTIYTDFEFEGSLDAVAWTSLVSVNLGGATQQIYAFPNTTEYQYYRLTHTPGTVPNVTRAYLYTWENEFGEESTPSLPVVGSGDINGLWTIDNICDPPPAPGFASYARKWLYRTVTGASGQTTYYRVAEVPIGTTTYADDTAVLTDAIIVGNLQLDSTHFTPPPDDMDGFVAMPNGYLVGFVDNNVYMSEPYLWHAWPVSYKVATEAPVVGLGVFGQTCIICTESYPTTATGAHPAACAFAKMTTGEPCLSRGSIVSTPEGVLYASQNGLVMIGAAGIGNVTKDLITRDDWLTTYRPETLRAVRYQNGYLALQARPDGDNKGFMIDPSQLKVALTEFTDFADLLALNVDIWSGEVFAIKQGVVLHWDPPTSDIMPVRWLSKEFQYVQSTNFGCYAVFWDDKRYSSADWGNRIMPRDQKVRVAVFADRRKVYDQEVLRNGEAIRLPSGFKADIWQFEIRARAPVYALHVASTVKELKAV